MSSSGDRVQLAEAALRKAGAREVSPAEAPELHRLVEELATFARTPEPRVAIIDSLSPNAFAAGRDANHAVVAVTTGLLGLPLVSVIHVEPN